MEHPETMILFSCDMMDPLPNHLLTTKSDKPKESLQLEEENLEENHHSLKMNYVHPHDHYHHLKWRKKTPHHDLKTIIMIQGIQANDGRRSVESVGIWLLVLSLISSTLHYLSIPEDRVKNMVSDWS